MKRREPAITNESDPPTLSLSGKRGAGKETTIDEKYKDQLKQTSWFLTTKGYARGKYNGKNVYLARLVMIWHLGRELIKGEQIDHIDRNKLNNVTSNLRLASNLFNNMNKGIRGNNTSGYIGVSLIEQSKKYRACISVGGKSNHLGTFLTTVEAALAYNKSLANRSDVPDEFKQYNTNVYTKTNSVPKRLGDISKSTWIRKRRKPINLDTDDDSISLSQYKVDLNNFTWDEVHVELLSEEIQFVPYPLW